MLLSGQALHLSIMGGKQVGELCPWRNTHWYFEKKWIKVRLHFYPFLTNEVIHIKLISRYLNKHVNPIKCSGFAFQKPNGSMLETLKWDLNLGALKNLKNLCLGANLLCPSFGQNVISKFSTFLWQSKCKECSLYISFLNTYVYSTHIKLTSFYRLLSETNFKLKQ